MVRVAVIGAGVIGLSSAVRVLELYPNADVIVIADKFPPYTTSDVSGGFWEPHLLGDTPEQDIRKWSSETLNHMLQLANSDSARYTGASLVSGYQLNENPNEKPPFWRDLAPEFRLLEQHECQRFPNMKSGFFYTVGMVEPNMYLQFLMKRAQRRGARFKKRFVKNLQEVADEGYDVIMNCTGVGARDLVGDMSVRPVRGQVIRAHAPWIKNFLVCIGKDDIFYMLPSTNFVVLGGVEYLDDWNMEVSESDKKMIWDRCIKYVPSLTEATIDSDHVGLRPSRPTVRLELETVNVNGRKLPVVHNYGHGGAGVTLHWGCAGKAAQLVKQALDSAKAFKPKL